MDNSFRPRITRLRIKNYRSLADVDIELGDLNVFVGKNGSGKSSIIDALRFVRDALSRGLDAAILDRGGMSAIRRWSAKGRPYDITILANWHQIAILDENPHNTLNWFGEYGFTLASESRGEYRVKWERLLLPEGQFAQHLETKDDHWIRFPQTLEIFDDDVLPLTSPDLIKNSLNIPLLIKFLSSVASSTLSSESIGISGDLIFSSLMDSSFYTIYPDMLREPQRPANPHPLDERGQNLASVLRELKRRKDTDFAGSLRSALERVVEGVHDYSVKQVGSYLVTSLHHNLPEAGRQGPAFDLAQESDGTLRMLGILTALYQEPPRTLITIEEPEITIHPGALGVLCDVLQEASTRSQILITTHNPDLIDRFPAETLRVVEKVDGMTQVGPISQSQREAVAQKLFSPGELMRIEGLRSDAEPLTVEA